MHIFEWATGATGFTQRLHCPGLEGEDLAVAVLQLDNGAMVTLDTAWCAHGEELSVHGTLGCFAYRDEKLALASVSGPFEGRVARYNGGQVAGLRSPAGRRAADAREAAFVCRYYECPQPAQVVSGGGTGPTSRTAFYCERRAGHADRDRVLRIGANRTDCGDRMR